MRKLGCTSCTPSNTSGIVQIEKICGSSTLPKAKQKQASSAGCYKGGGSRPGPVAGTPRPAGAGRAASKAPRRVKARKKGEKHGTTGRAELLRRWVGLGGSVGPYCWVEVPGKGQSWAELFHSVPQVALEVHTSKRLKWHLRWGQTLLFLPVLWQMQAQLCLSLCSLLFPSGSSPYLGETNFIHWCTSLRPACA